MQGRYNVLFLCTGNSARSTMAEAIMNSKGRPNFTAYSAGSRPTGRVNSHALKMIQTARLPIEGLRSKAWDEFAKPGAPEPPVLRKKIRAGRIFGEATLLTLQSRN